MAEADLTVIRVGESVWSTWEPEDGRFDLEWLEPVLDGAQQRGISVILGTPTYAIPPWLARKYPEVRAERRTGERIPYGHRQDADYSHPAFRYHADRVVRQVVGRYVDHPAIIGYQVDNEPGMELFHNRGAFQTFVDRLRERYEDVEALNDRWGLVYWSHRLSRWDDLWVPDGNTVPSYDLAWRRFQSALTSEFISEQAAIVREIARADQFVTTCMALSRRAFDPADLNRELDIAAVNPYYPMQDALTMPTAPPEAAQARPRWNRHAGTSGIYLQADLTRAARDQPFLVTETNAMAIGEPHSNFPAYDGQWRQAAWALVARGARMVEYWHWHSNHFGHEAYWLGVLNHDGEPGRCYDEVRRIAGELKRAGAAVADLVPDADVGLLYSRESRWAMEFHSPLPVEGGLDARRRRLRPDLRPLLRRHLRCRPAGRHRLPAASRQRRRRARGPLAGARGPRRSTSPTTCCWTCSTPTRGRAAISCSASAAAMPTTRRGRARRSCRAGCARRSGPATASTRTSRCRSRCARGRTPASSLPDGAARDGLGGRARARGRGDARGLRAPAPRSLGGGDHQRARRRPRDLRRHAARPAARRRARPLAAARARRLGGPARDGHGHERPQPRGGTRCGSCRTGRGSRRSWRCPWRRETCCPRQSFARGEALDLAAWDVRVLLESPRGEINEEGMHREEHFEARRSALAARAWSCCAAMAALVARLRWRRRRGRRRRFDEEGRHGGRAQEAGQHHGLGVDARHRRGREDVREGLPEHQGQVAERGPGRRRITARCAPS